MKRLFCLLLGHGPLVHFFDGRVFCRSCGKWLAKEPCDDC